MAKVKTIQQMANTVRPEIGELDEEGDEGGGEFADDQGTTSVCQRPDKPADEALQKLLCVILSQVRAFCRQLSSTTQMKSSGSIREVRSPCYLSVLSLIMMVRAPKNLTWSFDLSNMPWANCQPEGERWRR